MSILVVDPVYNPNLVATITSATKLGPGITIAKFLGAYGDRTSFNHTSNTNNTKPEAGTNKSREVDQTFFKCKALKLCLGLTELAQEALLRCILKNADSELQDEGRDEEKEVQVQQEGDGSSEKTGEGD